MVIMMIWIIKRKFDNGQTNNKKKIRRPDSLVFLNPSCEEMPEVRFSGDACPVASRDGLS